jgi:uncharacterized protein (DUF302 family)
MRLLSVVILSGLLALMPAILLAASVSEREGWEVILSEQSYEALLSNLRTAIGDENMGLVTDVGPTEVAAQRGENIPGNRVLGVFRNDFAVRAVRANVAAMIEAPVRFYVTEDKDGTATLSWKTPSTVFSPYYDEGGEELRAVAEELDTIFRAIAARATGG